MTEDLPFIVEERDAADEKVVEVLARTSNAIIGRAAFDKAIEINPRRRLMLRDRARVIARHPAADKEG